jgi:mannose-1-phosphate guanylyltransferase/mannose-6-phosphate isomerase
MIKIWADGDRMMDNKTTVGRYTIDADSSILAALKKMDENALRNLIVQSNNEVVGVLADGDVRRALLRGCSLEDKTSSAMNASYIYLNEGDAPQRIIDTFQNDAIGIVPIINGSRQLKNVLTRRIFEEMILSRNNVTTDFDLSAFEEKDAEYAIVSRPWGFYKTTVLNELFQSKIIYVLPNQSLSLQSHMRREEYWTIIDGEGKIQLDQSIRQVYPGDMTFIPRGCKHRITNTSNTSVLVFSEIQLGDYFGEDDIKRYEDTYGRC